VSAPGGSAAADARRRWRLVLGGVDEDDATELSGLDARRDAVLEALYDSDRAGGLGSSSPRVARWLGDIRTYFPSTVVQVMQRDALDRLGLRQLLLEPELLSALQPDVSLVTALLSLRRAIPERSRETARAVVRQVVEQLQRRLDAHTRQAVTGALARAARSRTPRPGDIDWNRTVAANLSRYQPELRTVIPERLVGHARRAHEVQRDVIVAIDQSQSMADSVVYAGVFAAALASLRAVSTRVVAFDTAVADLSDHLDDPVDVLFGIQLGGGTDIAGALGYCRTLVTRPRDTILVLISDLYEGGSSDDLLRRCAELVHAGVVFVALLALSDEGAPSYDHETAAALAGLGVPAFACTPELFPELLAAAVQRHDLAAWAGAHGVATAL
jgi:Mg-chelatase subunit ChlD